VDALLRFSRVKTANRILPLLVLSEKTPMSLVRLLAFTNFLSKSLVILMGVHLGKDYHIRPPLKQALSHHSILQPFDIKIYSA